MKQNPLADRYNKTASRECNSSLGINREPKKTNQVNYNRGILSSSKDLIGLLGKPIHFLNGLFIYSFIKERKHSYCTPLHLTQSMYRHLEVEFFVFLRYTGINWLHRGLNSLTEECNKQLHG